MKHTQYLLLISALLLCLYPHEILLSNPDSEIVQENDKVEVKGKEAGEGSVQKSAQMRNDENRERYLDQSGRRRTRVKVLDFVPGIGYVWRDFEDIYDSFLKVRDRSILRNFYEKVRNASEADDSNRKRPPSTSPAGGNRQWNNNGPGFPQGGYRPSEKNDPSVPDDRTSTAGNISPTDTATVDRRVSQIEKGENSLPSTSQNPIEVQSDQERKISFSTTTPFSGNSNRGERPGTDISSGASSPAGTRVSAFQPQTISNYGGRIAPASLDSNLFAGIVNNFAFKLTESLNPQSNFVLSPLSIFVAVAMCYLGSEGRTKAQLESVMGLNENNVHEEHLHNGISNLVASMVGDRQHELLLANGLFLGLNFTPDARYREVAQRYYGAHLQNIDFSNQDLSLSIINQWVSRNTKNAIPSFLVRPVPPQTRMLLLNAVYFRGLWKTQFPTDLTYRGTFRSYDGSNKEVLYMALYGESFPMYRSDEYRHTFIKLPYSGDKISMIIALPHSSEEIPMSSVRGQTLCNVLDAMRNSHLGGLAIPKFRLEDVRSFGRSLIQLGAGNLFDRWSVDLRKLRPQNDVFATDVLQKALVEVTEEGTTAAAVTAVRFIPLTIRNTTDFVVDRPFAFYIIHEPSGLVLFYGKVLDIGLAQSQDGSDNGNYRSPTKSRSNTASNVENVPRNRRQRAVRFQNTDGR